MSRLHYTAIALLAVSTVAGADAATHTWRTYHNPRFGTEITYPADIFRSATEPDNADGVTFHAADGATLAVFGQWIMEESDTPAHYEAFLRNSDPARYRGVSYRFADQRTLVLSGTIGSRIFYERYTFVDPSRALHAMVLEYPAARRDAYAPLAMRMSASLHWTRPKL